MAIYYNNQLRNYYFGSTGSLGAMYYGNVEVNPGQTSGGGGGDINATAYINAIIAAGGTLSGAQQTAIDTFFVDLKADGIYSKLYFMYPFLGGVANSNKINAINPGTNDLTFYGTWTHSTTGSNATLQDGSTYADTGYDINTSTATSNWSFGQIHKHPSGAPLGYGYSGTGPSSNYMVVGRDGITLDNFYNDNSRVSSVTPYGGSFWGVIRSASTSWKSFYLVTGSVASSGPSYSSTLSNTWTAPGSTTSVYINKINPSGFPSIGLYTFAFAAQALSDSEMTNLAINLNNLQIAIGNNIFS